MDVVGFLKEIFNKLRKPKQNLLVGDVDPNFNNRNKSKLFRESNRVEINNEEQDEQVSLDDCILEYISQYIKQVDMGTKKDISYNAFTRMFYGLPEEVGQNAVNQEKLKDKIEKSNKYRVDGQYSSTGKPIFYHISRKTEETQEISDKDPNLTRIYLNCERKNISRLAGEVLKKLDKIDGCTFKMKFMAESDESEKSKRYQRNDKIVIYTPNDLDKVKIIGNLMELKREKPELFSARKKLPLIPKVDGFIGYTKQGKSIVSTPLHEARYEDTYNSKLATIMEDCLIVSLREISARDAHLVYAIDGYYGEDTKQYLRTFQMMNPEQVQEVVKMFKTEFIASCEKSHINLDIEQEHQNQER